MKSEKPRFRPVIHNPVALRLSSSFNHLPFFAQAKWCSRRQRLDGLPVGPGNLWHVDLSAGNSDMMLTKMAEKP